MSLMSKKLNDLHEMNLATTEEKSRLKTENAVFQERIHVLEEQTQINDQRYAFNKKIFFLKFKI